MPDKVKLNIDKDKATITEGAETGLGKILMAAQGKVTIAGREVKIKKDKKTK